jgi:hypothetical protein
MLILLQISIGQTGTVVFGLNSTWMEVGTAGVDQVGDMDGIGVSLSLIMFFRPVSNS